MWFSLPSHLFPTRCFHTTSTDDFHSDLMSCTANLFQILNGESNSTEHGCYGSCLIYIVNLLAFQGVRTGSVYLKLTQYSFLLLCALVYEVIVCLTSWHYASVSRGQICSDNCMCCHTEIEVADQTFHLTQSQYTDTGPASPSTDPITPGAWQGSHWSANFEVTGMTQPKKNLGASQIQTQDLPLSRRTP